MRHRAPAWLALLIVLVSLLTACSVGSKKAPAHGEPPLGTVLKIVDTDSFALPLDPFRLGSRNLPLSSKAADVLTNRCLARFGFAPLPAAPALPTATGPSARRYGITNLSQAQTRGYRGTAPQVAVPKRPVLSAAEQAVLSGTGQSSYGGQQVPSGGCLADAQRRLQLGAPTVDNISLGEDLSSETYDRSMKDSRVQKVFADWSQCMKTSGYNYANPSNAIDDPAFVTPQPSPHEIAVAVADVLCKRKTNLVGIWATVETAYQKGALEANAEALTAIQRNFQTQEKNAAKILAGS